MNQRNQKLIINYLNNILKTFVSKLMQNPEYYDIKYYSKIKGRDKHRNNFW